MKSAAKLGLLGALLGAASALCANTDARPSRDAAAASVGELILKRLEEAATAFPPAAKKGARFEVRGVDELGKDLAPPLQSFLNEGIGDDAEHVVIFFAFVARSGSHLKELSYKISHEGVVSTFFAMFSANEEAKKQPWLLVPDVNPSADGDQLAQRLSIIKGLSSLAAKDAAEAGDPIEVKSGELPDFLKELLGNARRPGGCEGCCTGMFTAKGKSVYAKFCPGNAIGEVLGGVAPHLDAVGRDPITVTVVPDEEVPEGTQFVSITS